MLIDDYFPVTIELEEIDIEDTGFDSDCFLDCRVKFHNAQNKKLKTIMEEDISRHLLDVLESYFGKDKLCEIDGNIYYHLSTYDDSDDVCEFFSTFIDEEADHEYKSHIHFLSEYSNFERLNDCFQELARTLDDREDYDFSFFDDSDYLKNLFETYVSEKTNNKKEKEDCKMEGFEFTANMNNSFMDSFIKETTGIIYDLQTGIAGVVDNQKNIITLVKKGKKFLLNKSPFVLGMSAPAFAVLTPVANLVQGDIVIMDDDNMGFYIDIVDSESNSVENQSIKVVDLSGKQSEYAIAENNMLGSGVMAVKSLFAMGGMNNGMNMTQMLPMIMMMKPKNETGKRGIGKTIAIMALMNMMNDPNNNPMQTMMPMLLANDEGNDDMFKMMCMMNMQNPNMNQGMNQNNMAPMFQTMMMMKMFDK